MERFNTLTPNHLYACAIRSRDIIRIIIKQERHNKLTAMKVWMLALIDFVVGL